MKLNVNLIGNATFTLTINEDIKFAIDPALAMKGSGLGFNIFRKTDPIYSDSTFSNIDFWLITHAHLDHVDEYGLKYLNKNNNVISSPSAKSYFNKKNMTNINYIDWNEKYIFTKDGYEIEIIAIPAYHGFNPIILKLMGKVNGYILKIKKDNEIKKIYITSDTVINRKLINDLKQFNDIDLLIANVGEAKSPVPITSKPITMNIDMLKSLASSTNAKNVLPIHIDDYTHFRTNRTELKKIFNIINNGESIIYNV